MSRHQNASCRPILPLSSSCPGLGTSLQLSGPGGRRSGMPSLSSSSSHSSPNPSLSVSSCELLMMVGQLSVLSWCPSPSLRAQRQKEMARQHQLLPLHRDGMGALGRTHTGGTPRAGNRPGHHDLVLLRWMNRVGTQNRLYDKVSGR